MQKSTIALSLISLAILAGCANNGVQTPKTSADIEAEEERQAVIKTFKETYSPPKPTYIQPVNKTEKCLLPSNPTFDSMKGAKAYWDGGCMNGFAFGTGREIDIADDGYHKEEVITYGSGLKTDGPFLSMDYKNNSVVWGTVSHELVKDKTDNVLGNFGKKLGNLFSSEEEKPKEIKVHRVASVNLIPSKENKNDYVAVLRHSNVSEEGQYISESNSANQVKTYAVIKDGVVYKIDNFKEVPQNGPASVAFQLTLLNAQTGKPIGPVITSFANGAEIATDPKTNKRIDISNNYLVPIKAIMEEATPKINQAINTSEGALAFLHDYGERICSNRNVPIPKGLTKQKYFEICTFPFSVLDKAQKKRLFTVCGE